MNEAYQNYILDLTQITSRELTPVEQGMLDCETERHNLEIENERLKKILNLFAEEEHWDKLINKALKGE